MATTATSSSLRLALKATSSIGTAVGTKVAFVAVLSGIIVVGIVVDANKICGGGGVGGGWDGNNNNRSSSSLSILTEKGDGDGDNDDAAAAMPV